MTVQTSVIWGVTGRHREMEQKWRNQEECSRSDCWSLGRHGRRRYWVLFVWQPEVMTMTTGDDDGSRPRRARKVVRQVQRTYLLTIKRNCPAVDTCWWRQWWIHSSCCSFRPSRSAADWWRGLRRHHHHQRCRRATWQSSPVHQRTGRMELRHATTTYTFKFLFQLQPSQILTTEENRDFLAVAWTFGARG